MMKRAGRPATTCKSHNKVARTYSSADRNAQTIAAKAGRSITSYFRRESETKKSNVTESVSGPADRPDVQPVSQSLSSTTESTVSVTSSLSVSAAGSGTNKSVHVAVERETVAGGPTPAAGTSTLAPRSDSSSSTSSQNGETSGAPKTSDTDRFRDKVITFSRKYPWFEHREGEGAYCVICKAVALGTEKVQVWSRKPHDLKRDDKWNVTFRKHEQSKRHQNNVKILRMVKQWKIKGKGGIIAQIREGAISSEAAERTRHRRLLMHLLKSLLFMIQKRFAARHNFEDFVRFIAEQLEHPDLAHHLALLKRNATYLSTSTVDSLIKHIDAYLQDELKKCLESVSFFTLEADESTSESGNEMLSIYIKFIHPVTNELEEKFLTQVKMGASKTSRALYATITETLESKGVDTKKMFFVGLDTTNTMSGERGGLQRLLRHLQPMCKYQPCRSHKLALVLVHLMKKYSLLSEMDSLLITIWKKFKFSTNNKVVLEEALVVEGNKPLKMIKGCTTRWLTHGQSCRRVADILPALLDALASIYQAHHDPEIKGGRRIQFSALPQVKANFTQRVDSFRTSPTSVVDGVFATKAEAYTLLVKERSVDSRKTRLRPADDQAPSAIVREFWDEKASPFIQDFITEVNSAFQVPDPVLCAFQSLHPDAFISKETGLADAAAPIEVLFDFYGNPVSDCLNGDEVTATEMLDSKNKNVELEEFCNSASIAVNVANKDVLDKAATLRENLKQKPHAVDIESQVKSFIDKSKITTAGLFQALKQLETSELFPNIMKLLNLAAIIPSSTAEVERGFSLMNLLCTPLRASMLPGTLDKLIRICLNGRDLSQRDLNVIIDRFRDDSSVSSRRLSL